MSEKTEETAVNLDPATFKLGDWLMGTATSTTYRTTVRTDLESFRRVIDLQEQGRQVHADLQEATKQAEKSVGSGSLGETTPQAQEVERLTAEFAQLRKQHDKAKKLLDASALHVTFSADDRKMQRGVMPTLLEHFPELVTGGELTQSRVMALMRENPEIMEKQNAMMLHSTIESTVNGKGQVVKREDITLEEVENLIASVGNPDREKLFRHMNLAINSSNLTEEAIDAGFPG